VEPIHRVPSKLLAPDILDIMDRAWAFLKRTFKEVTPELEKAYMFFDYKAGRSTLNTLSDLEELCRLTNKPVEGRAVVAKPSTPCAGSCRATWSGSSCCGQRLC
jgi:hypothetical protein